MDTEPGVGAGEASLLPLTDVFELPCAFSDADTHTARALLPTARDTALPPPMRRHRAVPVGRMRKPRHREMPWPRGWEGSQGREGPGLDLEVERPTPLRFKHASGDPTTNAGNELGDSHFPDGETEGRGA